MNSDMLSPKENIFSPELSLKEAICIADIVKISHSFLGKTNKRLFRLCLRCEFLAERLKIKDKEWYQEFHELYKDIEATLDQIDANLEYMKKHIKEKYKSKFSELESKFNKKKNKEFIDFILEKYPYKDYQEDKKSKRIDTSKINQELLQYLRGKYHTYQYFSEEENSQFLYCIEEIIESYLNNLYENIQ